MKVEQLCNLLQTEFYTGVPDSLLRPFCDYVMDKYGLDGKHHIIAANEGNAMAIAAGYHLSTGRVPVVYMQNSGQGNAINPLASLFNDNVYALPCILVIGWRGQPDGEHDEPQHVFQGKITLKLLDVMDIAYFVISKDTTLQQVKEKYEQFQKLLQAGKQVAFVIQKGALQYQNSVKYKNNFILNREQVLRYVVKASKTDPIVSTTGKISREIFEIREALSQSHQHDFLTVGSMGHSSSIALGIALNQPDKKVWCVDGDGALLMHLGVLATIGNLQPKNLVHIVINNAAHESVGGMPTVAAGLNIRQIAKGCGYKKTVQVKTYAALEKALKKAKNYDGLVLIEVLCALQSRADLGRPTTTPIENKQNFMQQFKNQ